MEDDWCLLESNRLLKQILSQQGKIEDKLIQLTERLDKIDKKVESIQTIQQQTLYFPMFSIRYRHQKKEPRDA